jgi:hypothetical protein
MDQPIAEEALEKLATLVGEWTLEAMSAGGEPWPGGGRAVFEWHDSRAHLIERWTVDLPEAPDGISTWGATRRTEPSSSCTPTNAGSAGSTG